MHIFKNMDQLLGILIMPTMVLLLVRYVLGGAMDTGGTTYVNFLFAGILVQTLAFGASNTTFNLVLDLQKGVVDRLRSLPIWSPALLVGHVVADLVRNLLSGTIMLLVAFLIGFRPSANVQEWLLVIGIVVLFTFAISWLSAILGLLVKTVEAAQWSNFIIVFPLTFASSAFVPTEGMPKLLRIFAENQPVTHVIEAMRSLMVGTPMGNHAIFAILWCIVFTIIAIPVSAFLFRRYGGR